MERAVGEFLRIRAYVEFAKQQPLNLFSLIDKFSRQSKFADRNCISKCLQLAVQNQFYPATFDHWTNFCDAARVPDVHEAVREAGDAEDATTLAVPAQLAVDGPDFE